MVVECQFNDIDNHNSDWWYIDNTFIVKCLFMVKNVLLTTQKYYEF